MTDANEPQDDLVPLGEAERLCKERLGMSADEFRHELAEHVRGSGGLPWAATETAAGVHRGALDALLEAGREPHTTENTDE